MACAYGYRHLADKKLKPIHAFQCFGRWDLVIGRWYCWGGQHTKKFDVFPWHFGCFTSEVYTSSRVAEGHAYQILLWTLLLDFILTFLKSLVHIWKGKTSLHSAKATMAPWGKAISLSRKSTELKTFGCKDKPSWKKNWKCKKDLPFRRIHTSQ